jgi:hypothetical protein
VKVLKLEPVLTATPEDILFPFDKFAADDVGGFIRYKPELSPPPLEETPSTLTESVLPLIRLVIEQDIIWQLPALGDARVKETPDDQFFTAKDGMYVAAVPDVLPELATLIVKLFDTVVCTTR